MTEEVKLAPDPGPNPRKAEASQKAGPTRGKWQVPCVYGNNNLPFTITFQLKSIKPFAGINYH